jgi:small multidrug resistance pump
MRERWNRCRSRLVIIGGSDAGIRACVSFYLLSLTLKKMEVGVVYAIWSAVGTALIATIGILWFKEPISLLKIGSLALIILGVIGLNLSGVGH